MTAKIRTQVHPALLVLALTLLASSLTPSAAAQVVSPGKNGRGPTGGAAVYSDDLGASELIANTMVLCNSARDGDCPRHVAADQKPGANNQIRITSNSRPDALWDETNARVSMMDGWQQWQLKCGLADNVPPYGNDSSTRIGVDPDGTYNWDGRDAKHPPVGDPYHDLSFIYHETYYEYYRDFLGGWPPPWGQGWGIPDYPYPGLLKDTRAPFQPPYQMLGDEEPYHPHEVWQVKIGAPNDGATMSFVWVVNGDPGFVVPGDPFYLRLRWNDDLASAPGVVQQGVGGEWVDVAILPDIMDEYSHVDLLALGDGTFRIPGISQFGLDQWGEPIYHYWYLESGYAPEERITVVAPNGGEQWQRETDQTIEWGWQGNPGDVDIDLYKSGWLHDNIVEGTACDGAHTWHVPADLEIGDDYRIRITSTSDPDVWDESDLDFSIVEGMPTVYVDRNSPGPSHDGLTWDTAFLTIREGVNACLDGGQVWVADGTYVENVAMEQGVALYGGFLGAEPDGYEDSLDQRDFVNNATIIDGNQSGSCVIMAFEARVDGFTATNGCGNIEGNHRHGGAFFCNNLGTSGAIENDRIDGNSADSGGGVYCRNSSPSISSNTITRNAADYGAGICCESSSPTIAHNSIASNSSLWGGGIYCDYSSPMVTDNTISGNSATAGLDAAGGALQCRYSSPTVTCNIIVGNWASGESSGGGGISCYGDSPTVVYNTIGHNSAESGGGVYCIWESSLTLAGNDIMGNSAQRGGGIHSSGASPVVDGNVVAGNDANYGGAICCMYSSSLTVTGNTIASNSAGWGGALYCWDSCSPRLTGNTIARNTAPYGCALACDSYFQEDPSEVSIADSIVWDGGDEVWNDDSSAITITYSDVQGGWPGTGNIDVDPLFVNADSGDFHLTGGSPCIDKGTNSPPGGLPPTDWEGDDRVVNGVVDMGADEYLTVWGEAPIPQPGCGGPLFGGSQNGFPAWVWFSIPLTPDCPVGEGCADPNELLGFTCNGSLFYWDKYGKYSQVYKPPFVKWDLFIGDSYLLRLTGDVPNPGYWGLSPFVPDTFEFLMGRQGWTWVGMPGLTELTGDTFMDSVRVKYPSDDTGVYRTARQDRAATPDNWMSWGWPFFDTYLQAPKTFTPYAPFGNRTCYPWFGYRCWVEVGTALDEDDPNQVTLIWPRTGG